MPDQGDPLARIADALERLSPRTVSVDWAQFPAYVWDGIAGAGRPRIDAPALGQLRAIERQKRLVIEAIARHAAGFAAHDMLLWGARGTGKSALVRAAVASQQAGGATLALVQIPVDRLDSLPALFGMLSQVERQFIVLIDDLGFERADSAHLRLLRSCLEGGVDPRPSNVRLAVTANRRALVERANPGASLHESEELDEAFALADRFGLSIGFHALSQADYLAIVDSYAAPLALEWSPEEAIAWSRQRGALSGRAARQFVVELAGRAGKAMTD